MTDQSSTDVNSAVHLSRVERFPVEAGHIQTFARALADPNPIYADPDYAAGTPLGGIIAPPTFTEAANHFDIDWPYRPRPGRPWSGSAGNPSGTERPPGEGGTDMHAESHFVYVRPMRPGMVLSAHAQLGRSWTKPSKRAGELKFQEIVSTFRDADGSAVTECRSIVLRTEHTVAPEASSQSAESASEADLPVPVYPPKPLTPSAIEPGYVVRDTLVRDLSRSRIVMYAGASGDFAPQHTDEVYNTRVAGYPTVFAHGMLTMGMAGRVVTDFVGDGLLRKFGFQFRRMVWPGDSLFASLEVSGVDAGSEPSINLKLQVANQRAEVVGTGYAEAAMEPDR